MKDVLEKFRKKQQDDLPGNEKDGSSKGQESPRLKEIIKKFICEKIFDYSIFFLSEDEKSLLGNLVAVKSVKDNLPHWYRLNLFYPLVIIIVSVIVTFFANYHSTYNISISKDGFGTLWNIFTSNKFIQCLNSSIFNGSISLIAINSLLGASNYILSSEILGGTDNSSGIKQLFNVRKKYNFQLFSTFFYVSVLYIIQIAYPPQTKWGLLFYIIVIIYTLRRSLKVSKKLYYLRDEVYSEYSENK